MSKRLSSGAAIVGAGLSKFGAYLKEVKTANLFVEADTLNLSGHTSGQNIFVGGIHVSEYL